MPNLFDKFQDYVPVKDCIKERVNGDFLLVVGESLDLQYLNETAKFIYSNFDGKNTVLDIYNLLLKEYEIEEDMKENVKKDIVNTVRDFQWQRIAKLKSKELKK